MFIVLISLIFGLEFGCVQQEVDQTKKNIEIVYDNYNSTAQVYNEFIEAHGLDYPKLKLIEHFAYTEYDLNNIFQNYEQIIQLQSNLYNQLQSGGTVQYNLLQYVYQLINLFSIINVATSFIGQIIPIERGLWDKLGYTDELVINGFKWQRIDNGFYTRNRLQDIVEQQRNMRGVKDLQVRGNTNPYTIDDEEQKLDKHQVQLYNNNGSKIYNQYKIDVTDLIPAHEHNYRKGLLLKDDTYNYMNPTDVGPSGGTTTVKKVEASNIDVNNATQVLTTDVSDPHLQIVWIACVDIA